MTRAYRVPPTTSAPADRVSVRFDTEQLRRVRRVAQQITVTDERTGLRRIATVSDVVRMAALDFVGRVETEPLFSDPIGAGS